VCLALPDVVEAWAWNHPAFRVGKKTFCVFEMVKRRPSVGFRVTPAEAKRFVRRRHFFATPYGRSVWISRWVDVRVDERAIARSIEHAYRLVAPGRRSSPVRASSADTH
jgi:predicted DNA-binding protein (MmcQ/YjbR family)